MLTRFAAAASMIVGAVVVGAIASPGPDQSIALAADGLLGAGGEFHGLEPTRVFDSREPAYGAQRKASTDASTPTDFDVLVVDDAFGLPEFSAGGDGSDANVLAVVVNITVIGPTQAGYLQAFGKGAPAGLTSVVNFAPGEVVPNTALLRPGKDGKLTVRLVSPTPGSAHVAIDITGWFSSSNYDDSADPGARVIPTASPARVYDSTLNGGSPVGAGAWVKVPIRGATPVEGGAAVCADADTTGVVLNLTGVNRFGGSTATFASALPEKTASDPTTSNLNLVPGQLRANMTIMPLGADGSIQLFNLNGQVRLVVDVVGCLRSGLAESTRAGRVVPLVSPFRAFDTRQSEFYAQPLGPANAEDWSFESFVGDVKIGSDPVGSQAGLIGNLTGTALKRQYAWAPVTSYITAFPTPSSGDDVPTVSNLNLTEGQSVPNMAMLTYGQRPDDANCQGKHCVRFYNLAGYVDYILDVSAVILSD